MRQTLKDALELGKGRDEGKEFQAGRIVETKIV